MMWFSLKTGAKPVASVVRFAAKKSSNMMKQDFLSSRRWIVVLDVAFAKYTVPILQLP